jgi:hypothetical protein
MKKFVVIAILSVFGVAAYAQETFLSNGDFKGYISSEDGILFVEKTRSALSLDTRCKTLVKFPQNKNVDSYTVPAEVYVIGRGAFQGNKYIRTIRIPSTLYYIGDNAFDGCDNLISIEIYESTTSARAIEVDDSPSEVKEVGRYNIQGMKVEEGEDGKVQIILYSDGTTKKVMK